MMKTFILLLVMCLCSGCASLADAGHSTYEVKANAQGTHDLAVLDGKEYTEGRQIVFNAKNGTLAIVEGTSKAFKGQAIGAKALTILPLSDLVEILK